MIRTYGKTTAENSASESLKSRQIVQEVLSFGVSQQQILRIIYLLSLELEDRDSMLAITEAIKEHIHSLETNRDSSGIIE